MSEGPDLAAADISGLSLRLVAFSETVGTCTIRGIAPAVAMYLWTNHYTDLLRTAIGAIRLSLDDAPASLSAALEQFPAAAKPMLDTIAAANAGLREELGTAAPANPGMPEYCRELDLGRCPACGCAVRVNDISSQELWSCPYCRCAQPGSRVRVAQEVAVVGWSRWERVDLRCAAGMPSYTCGRLRSDVLSHLRRELGRWQLTIGAPAFERLYAAEAALKQASDDCQRTVEGRCADQAKLHLRELQALQPHAHFTAREWRLVGELLLIVGDKSQAAKAWQKAMQLDPKVGVKRKLAVLEKELETP